jgi:hypothetical protein
MNDQGLSILVVTWHSDLLASIQPASFQAKPYRLIAVWVVVMQIKSIRGALGRILTPNRE